MVCTARPLPVDRSMTAAQGPQGQTNLTDVLAAHSGAPARPRTPDSKQAHRHQGKKIGVTGDARIIRPFSRPRRERASAQRTQGSSGLAARPGARRAAVDVLRLSEKGSAVWESPTAITCLAWRSQSAVP